MILKELESLVRQLYDIQLQNFHAETDDLNICRGALVTIRKSFWGRVASLLGVVHIVDGALDVDDDIAIPTEPPEEVVRLPANPDSPESSSLLSSKQPPHVVDHATRQLRSLPPTPVAGGTTRVTQNPVNPESTSTRSLESPDSESTTHEQVNEDHHQIQQSSSSRNDNPSITTLSDFVLDSKTELPYDSEDDILEFTRPTLPEAQAEPPRQGQQRWTFTKVKDIFAEQLRVLELERLERQDRKTRKVIERMIEEEQRKRVQRNSGEPEFDISHLLG